MSKQQGKPYDWHGNCALCGTVYEDWGNNPVPVLYSTDQRVCNLCKSEVVIPVRLGILKLPWLERAAANFNQDTPA